MKKFVIFLVISLAEISAVAAPQLSLTPVGTVKTGLFRDADPRIAEINAYDAAGRRIYVVNPLDGSLDIIDASNPSLPADSGVLVLADACQTALGSACPLVPGGEPNSVAIRGKLMAVAVTNAVRTNNGHAVFFELNGIERPRFLAAIEVGAGPDMITFSEDGKYVLTANEGEPNATYSIDPPGSVSIIEVERLGTAEAVRQVGFERFDNPGQRAKLEREGVRIFGPRATLAQDLEPEYIAVSGNKAYVTLQENNALAIINISGATVEKIAGLGLKDHSVANNELDASDQDGGINIRTWPVHGLYQSDAIYPFKVNGQTYLVTANEGDAREYAGYVEAVRVSSAGYLLDPLVFPNAAALKANAALGRLTVSTGSGDADGDGRFERIEVFGGRSISIRDHQGNLVWDSGSLLERLSRQNDLNGINLFNTTNSANSRENRSDDKGIEPESVAVGDVNGRTYAFVGLERDSGIVAFDLSEPTAPALVTYAVNRKFPRNPITNALLACNNVNDCGDLGPEGLTFVPANQSPSGNALLIVSNEVSSTTTIWEVK
jgi:hypothetical protein